MDSLPPFLVHALQLPPLLKYGVIALISVFEGPILFTISGFFLRLGTEQFMPLAILVGNIVGDTFWYSFGYFFAGRMVRARGSFLGVTTTHLVTAEQLFEKYGGRMLILTKATLGFGTSVGIPAMFMAAGMTKVPFRRYMAFNLLGEAALLILFMSVGYTFGISYQSVSKDLRWLTAGSLLLLFIFGMYFVRVYLAKKKPLFD